MKKPARFLAIETSSPQLSIVLGDAKRVVSRYHGVQDGRHADELFEGLEKLMKKVRWPLESLTGIAVSIGPGSFTGIRIGLAAARTLGQFLKIPVVGVSSLETIAWEMSGGDCGRFAARGAASDMRRDCGRFAARGAASDMRHDCGRFAAAIDALQGRVFGAIYERTKTGGWKTILKPSYLEAAVWAKRSNQSPLSPLSPRAETLLSLARPRLAKAKPEDYKTVLPLYLREAAAVERRQGLRHDR